MNLIRKNFTIAIIPLLILAWGIFLLQFFDPFYSKSSDPEFPYLVNGLNCALAKFYAIGHYAHPGTPFQLFCGFIIRLTHLFSGNGNIVQDVFSRTNHYMNAISLSMLITQVILVFAIGVVGMKRKIAFWQIALLQSTCFFNDVLIWLLSRANPERFFLIVISIFILVYLKHGYENRSSRKFALWVGVVMALGLDTKFNFFPLLIIPLLLIDSNKNRLIYMGSCIISSIILLLPIIDKFDDYFQFLTGIFFHEGPYGSGSVKVFNLERMMNNISEIFRINPVLYFLLPALLFLVILSIIKPGKERTKEFPLLFAGFIVIIALEITIVSKQFANYYLVPIFTLYGFIFYSISLYFSKLLKNKILLIAASYILPLVFIFFTAVKVNADFSIISKMKVHREEVRMYVEKEIPKGDFWFIEPTWESGPHEENAIVYGLSYCGHIEDYIAQLKKVNPNIITFEGNENQVKLWRITPFNLDSLIATGKNINIYSTPGRNPKYLRSMLQNSANKHDFYLQTDTIYEDKIAEIYILRAKGFKPSQIWNIQNEMLVFRNIRIEAFVNGIKNSPEWLEKVKEKAVKFEIPLDSMIMLDAIWMVEN